MQDITGETTEYLWPEDLSDEVRELILSMLHRDPD